MRSDFRDVLRAVCGADKIQIVERVQLVESMQTPDKGMRFAELRGRPEDFDHPGVRTANDHHQALGRFHHQGLFDIMQQTGRPDMFV